MIIGIGTDLCDIRRIENSLERFGTRFKNRLFTKAEQSYADGKADPAASYAKRFAAKEALAKALSTGDTGHLIWTEVEVINGPSGKPALKLYGRARSRLEQMTPPGEVLNLHLSLSDEPPYALGFVIVESRSL